MRPLTAGAPGWGRKPRPGHTAAPAPALGAPSSGLRPHGPGARRRGGFRLAARLHGSRPVPRSRAFGAGRGLSAPPHGSPGLAVVCGAPAPRRGGSPGGLGEDTRPRAASLEAAGAHPEKRKPTRMVVGPDPEDPGPKSRRRPWTLVCGPFPSTCLGGVRVPAVERSETTGSPAGGRKQSEWLRTGRALDPQAPEAGGACSFPHPQQEGPA